MELVSRRRSPPASFAGGGPARVPIRYSSVSGFQGSRGVLSAPPRRFLPSAAQGDILRAPPPAVKGLSRLFPGRGRLKGLFPHMTWGDALRLPFWSRTHSLHKPRKGVRMRCGASRRARTGADQMFPSPTSQASPVPGHSEQLSGRIIRSEIRRRGRRITIYSSVMPRRDTSRFIVAPLTIRRGRALLEHPAS